MLQQFHLKTIFITYKLVNCNSWNIIFKGTISQTKTIIFAVNHATSHHLIGTKTLELNEIKRIAYSSCSWYKTADIELKSPNNDLSEWQFHIVHHIFKKKCILFDKTVSNLGIHPRETTGKYTNLHIKGLSYSVLFLVFP